MLRLPQRSKIQTLNFSTAANKAKTFDEMPGPPAVPFLGSSWKYFPFIGEFKTSNLDRVSTTLYERYGPIVRQTAGKQKVVHLFDPRDFETVHRLCQQTDQQIRESFSALRTYRESKPQLYSSSGILPEQGDTWWNNRRVTQKPISCIKETRAFLPTDDEIIRELTDKLGEAVLRHRYLYMGNRLSMELTLMYLFGRRYRFLDDDTLATDSYLSKLFDIVVSFTDKVAYFDQAAFYWSFPSRKEYKKMAEEFEFTERFVLQEIEKVKKRRTAEDTCIVTQLIDKYQFDNGQVGNVVDLFYGGVDTTGVTSNFLLYEIGRNKRVQNKMREEVSTLLPRGRESVVTGETLDRATYLKAVIKENFRLNPIVTVQNRRLPESVRLGGYDIPKGTVVLLETFAACRSENNFKDASTFKPERWLKQSEGFEESHPFALLSFGLGTRTCIARRRAEQILQALVLRILSEYEVGYDGEQVGYVTPFLLKPDKPIDISFKKLLPPNDEASR